MTDADQPHDSSVALEGGSWWLDRGLVLPAGGRISARFVGGTLSGSIAGRPYRAEYEWDADTARLRIAAATGGPGRPGRPGQDATERDYRRLLAAVERAHTPSPGSLTLLDGQGDTVLWFVAAPAIEASLVGHWQVLDVRRGEGLVAPVRGGTPTLDVDANGLVSGSAGVNRIRGRARTDGDALHLGPLAITRMAGGAEAMDEEEAMLAALDRVARYRLEGDALILLDADGEPMIRLRRGPATS